MNEDYNKELFDDFINEDTLKKALKSLSQLNPLTATITKGYEEFVEEPIKTRELMNCMNENMNEKLINHKQEFHNKKREELNKKLNLKIIDSGVTFDGEYFRAEYLGLYLQICVGEITKDIIDVDKMEVDENGVYKANYIINYPISFFKTYFIFLNNKEYTTNNWKQTYFELEIKFNNKLELEKFKENKLDINYLAIGVWR